MKLAPVPVAIVLAILLFTQIGTAHKGITSKFTYNTDVYPVFLSRCGGCHVDGGVGPMSLLKYEDAFPWAESLRAELLAAAAGADTAPVASKGEEVAFVKAAHRQISARELDIVLDWATGGTPEGDEATPSPPPALRNDWVSGSPDLEIAPAKPFVMPTDAMEASQEFVMPIPIAQPLTVDRLDLLPGNPAIVRTATISLRSRDGQTRLLGTWFPRQVPIPLSLKPSARLDPGAELIARIYYKKTWKFEGQAMTDLSRIGFYVAD